MKNIVISDVLKSNYENYYSGGDSTWRAISAMKKAENIIALCERYPHRSILEIGAGEGSLLKQLDEQSFGDELFALEVSSSGVEVIKNKQISRLTECLLFEGYDIPFKDQQFDLAILSHVLEHVEFPRKLLYEASRVARYIFIEVPLEDNIRLKNDFIFDKVGHINFYSPKTFRRLIQTCNLQVLEQTITNTSKAAQIYQNGKKGLLKYYIKEYILRALPGIASKIFTYHSSIVCRPKTQFPLA